MSEIMYVNVALAFINMGLALVLAIIYGRNLHAVRSPFTISLFLFAAFLIVHNAVTAYHFLAMMTMFAQVDETLVLVEGLLQTVALGALTYATVR